MRGLMMETPLLISSLIETAARSHGGTEIVTRTVEGPVHRTDYAGLSARARRLAGALGALGIAEGDRVATLAWNTHRHLEVYYAVSGMGAVCHTVNPRLFPAQVTYILNHAADRIAFVDLSFVPLLEQLAPELPHLERVVVMTDAEHMPETTFAGALAYEDLIAGGPADFVWPLLDEDTASSLCYSSGTTGNPKGVLYSHRTTLLHTFVSCMPDVLGLSARDAVMPVVPMFHVNAWGLPYSAVMAGAKLVLPGPNVDGASLQALIEDEGVTFSAGVPTVWLGLLEHLRKSGGTLGRLERLAIGGSAVPRSMIEAYEDSYGVRILHAWGMTEMSPLGTVNTPKNGMEGESREARIARKLKQGRPPFGVEMKITGEGGATLPHDGKAFGELKVRGLWVCSGYYGEDGSDAHDEDGWFATGDVSTIDPDGYMQITDRAKDVIKSGGEWISSIELENIAMGHPDVVEAAVVAVPHERWDERPLVIAVRREQSTLTAEALRAYYEGKVARWSVPDEVVFVESLPHTATGKLLKTELRARYRDRAARAAE